MKTPLQHLFSKPTTVNTDVGNDVYNLSLQIVVTSRKH